MTKDANGAKVWEVLLKASVPIVIIVAGAMLRNEIVDSRQDHQIEGVEEHVKDLRDNGIPKWLRDAVTRIESAQAMTNSKLDDMDVRLVKLEAKVR